MQQEYGRLYSVSLWYVTRFIFIILWHEKFIYNVVCDLAAFISAIGGIEEQELINEAEKKHLRSQDILGGRHQGEKCSHTHITMCYQKPKKVN